MPSSPTSARIVITDAFNELGVFVPGDTPPPEAMTFALGRLNRMMGSWAIQFGTIPAQAREVFSLVSGKGGPSNPYTIGPGGDFNTSRPGALNGAGLLLNASGPAASVVEIPRDVYTDDEYRAIQLKDLPNTLFTGVYYNDTFAGGLGQIFLWPVPNTTVNSLVIYRMAQLSEFSSLDASYDCPNGYPEALMYNLAVRLSKPYAGQMPTPDLVQNAASSLATIKRVNLPMSDLPSDYPLSGPNRGWYNINTGTGG